MLFYSTLVLIITFLGIIEYRLELKKEKKVILIFVKILPFLILFILNTFKADSVGYDSVSYHNWYNNLCDGLRPGGSYSSTEKGFKILIETFARFKAPYILFYSFVNLLVYSMTGFATIKLSKNSSFSTLIYVCLSVMVLNFSALRQSVAMAMTFLALYFLLKKKWWGYIIFLCLVILGGLFHRSALAFLLCLPLSFIKMKAIYLWYATPFVLLYFWLSPSLFQAIYYSLNITSYMPKERNGVGEYFFIFYLIFFVITLLSESNFLTNFVFLYIDKIKIKLFKKSKPLSISEYQPTPENSTNILLTLFLIGVLLQATSRINYSAPRLATQFLMICCLFIPNTLLTIKNNKFKIALCFMACLCFYAFFVYDSILPNYLGVDPFKFL